MQPRIENPAVSLGILGALQRLSAAAAHAGVEKTTLKLIELRASQINSCSVCTDMHWRELRALGVPDPKIMTVGAWRETPYFSDAERAALDLTEAVTRLADRPDPVPDAIWDAAAAHYDETQLAGIVLNIASINAWNRLNAATRQVTGDWIEQWVASPA